MNYLTIGQLRALTSTSTDEFVYITDIGKEGIFRYDLSDTLSLDNTGSIIVTAGGIRFKRIIGGEVSSGWFNAIGDGVNDDTNALINALETAVKFANGNLTIPKTDNFYRITSTIYNRLTSGNRINIVSNGATIKTDGITGNNSIWNLTPVREHVVFSLGKQGTGNEVRTAFDNNLGTEVSVSGLTIDCSSFPYTVDPQNNNVDIAIALQISAEIANISNVTVQNVIGYGVRTHGARIATLADSNYLNVGLRDKNGASPNYTGADSYGDAIYFSGNKSNGRIVVNSVNCKSIDTVSKRGRSAVTFEFSNPNNVSVIIQNSTFDYYSKVLHIEAETTYNVTFDNCSLSRFNALIASAISDTKAYFVNCIMNMTGVDAYESVSAPYISFLYQSNPTFNFNSCKFIYTGNMDTISGITGAENFSNCSFNFNNKRLSLADSLKDTLFTSCSFTGFGSDIGTSAFTNFTANNGSSYTLSSCIFYGSETFRIANTDGKAKVTFLNSRHSTKQELLVSNTTPIINDILPFESDLVTKTRIKITGSELILSKDNTGSPLWDAMRFSAIVIGADQASSSRDINRSLILSKGYWLVDYIWVVQGWHLASATLVGTEPSGFSIKTSNGGVTWLPDTNNGSAVKEIVVLYFPIHMKSFFM